MARRVVTDEEGVERPRRRRLGVIWLIVFLAVAALTVVALEVTAQPWFCGSCHEMQPAHQGWLESAHNEDEEAECMDCHADPGIVGYFQAHVVAGLRDVYVHFIAGPPEQVEDSYVPPKRCLRCHGELFEDPEFTDGHPDEDEYCPDCHREDAHENDRPE